MIIIKYFWYQFLIQKKYNKYSIYLFGLVVPPLDVFGWLAIGYSEPLVVPPVEPVTLKSLLGHRRGHRVLKVNKTVVEFSPLFCFLFDESGLNKARVGSKDMSNFSLVAIVGNSIDIETTRGIGWDAKKLGSLLLILIWRILDIWSLSLVEPLVLHLVVVWRVLRGVGRFGWFLGGALDW